MPYIMLLIALLLAWLKPSWSSEEMPENDPQNGGIQE